MMAHKVRQVPLVLMGVPVQQVLRVPQGPPGPPAETAMMVALVLRAKLAPPDKRAALEPLARTDQ